MPAASAFPALKGLVLSYATFRGVFSWAYKCPSPSQQLARPPVAYFAVAGCARLHRLSTEDSVFVLAFLPCSFKVCDTTSGTLLTFRLKSLFSGRTHRAWHGPCAHTSQQAISCHPRAFEVFATRIAHFSSTLTSPRSQHSHYRRRQQEQQNRWQRREQRQQQ